MADLDRMVERSGLRSRKVLEISSEGTRLQKYFYTKAQHAAAEGQPVVWCCPFQPVEMLFAMDIVPVYPINYSAIIAAKQMSAYYLNITEQQGYYQDLCRYCSRNIMGYIWDNNFDRAPWGGMAKPTAILGNVMCDPTPVVWELIGQYYKAPVFYFDRVWPADYRWMEQFPVDENGLPADRKPRRSERLWQYWREMMKELVVFLEYATGRRLEEGRLRKVMEISRQTCWYAAQTDLLRQKVPCPVATTDHFPNSIAFNFYRGTAEALEHTRKVYLEVKERADKGLGVVPREKYRLIWIGVPVWTSPGFYNIFEEAYGAVFVWEHPHFPAWMGLREPKDCWDDMINFAMFFAGESGLAAQSYSSMFLPYCRIPGNIDGAIIANMRSCKAIASGLRYYEKELDKLGIPHITVTMDPVDPREWDEKRVIAQVVSLIETLKPRT